MNTLKRITIALCAIIASSCELNNTSIQPTVIDPGLALNSIMQSTAYLFNEVSSTGSTLTRQINAGGADYSSSIRPETFDAPWSIAYGSVLSYAHDLMIGCVPNPAKPNERYARHMGIARIIQAYCLIMLSDMFGDIPFSQAFQGSGNLNPVVDSQASIYAKALVLLDSAKLDLTTQTPFNTPPGYLSPNWPQLADIYYGNTTGATYNFSKWILLANTLKLKIYLNKRLIDPSGAAAGINALIADNSTTGGLIGYTPDHAVSAAGQSENFVYRYGLSNRHPAFSAQYTSGGGDYQSNWLMWHMFHGYNATHKNGIPGDPRMRFYFNRQVLANTTNTGQLPCANDPIPDHYPSSTGSSILDNTIAGRPPLGVSSNMPTNDATNSAWWRTFCTPTDRGYWGRDHLNDQALPDDGLLRTAYGVYPVGGRFDANLGGGVNAYQGQLGAGIEPMLTRSFVNFMLAEAALYLPLSAPAMTARQYYQNAIDQSFVDVRDWAVKGTYNTNTAAAATGEAATINSFYPPDTYTTDKLNYTTSALAAFDDRLLVSADEAMNYVAREYWIASFKNGVEAYTLYRRNGMPTGMQPALSQTPGAFPRSYWYPASLVNLNNTVNQKPDLTQRVFWDINASNLDF